MAKTGSPRRKSIRATPRRTTRNSNRPLALREGLALTVGQMQPSPAVTPVRLAMGALNMSRNGGVRLIDAVSLTGPAQTEDVSRVFLISADGVEAWAELGSPVHFGAAMQLLLPKGLHLQVEPF